MGVRIVWCKKGVRTVWVHRSWVFSFFWIFSLKKGKIIWKNTLFSPFSVRRSLTHQTSRALFHSKWHEASRLLQRPTGVVKAGARTPNTTPATGGVQKPHAYRPGTFALCEMRRYQKTTELSLRKAPLARTVPNIMADEKRETRNEWFLHASHRDQQSFFFSFTLDNFLIIQIHFNLWLEMTFILCKAECPRVETGASPWRVEGRKVCLRFSVPCTF